MPNSDEFLISTVAFWVMGRSCFYSERIQDMSCVVGLYDFNNSLAKNLNNISSFLRQYIKRQKDISKLDFPPNILLISQLHAQCSL